MALIEPADVNSGDTITAALWNEFKGLLFDASGDQLYAENNFVTDDQTFTASINALDIGLKDITTAAQTFSSTASFTGVTTFSNTALHILDTNASHDLIFKVNEDLSQDITLNLVMGDNDRTFTMGGNNIVPTWGVGTGLSSIDGTLHVHTSSVGAVSAIGDANDLVVESSGATGMTIFSANASFSRIIMGSPADTDAFAILYQQSTNLGFIGTTASGGIMTIRVGASLDAIICNASQQISMGPGSSTTPDGTLHVITSAVSGVTAVSTADDLVVERNTAGGISVLVPNTSFSSFVMGSPADNDAFNILYQQSTNAGFIGTTAAGGTMTLRSGGGVDGLVLDGSQDITMASLAGSGSRTVVADANGKLSAP